MPIKIMDKLLLFALLSALFANVECGVFGSITKPTIPTLPPRLNPFKTSTTTSAPIVFENAENADIANETISSSTINVTSALNDSAISVRSITDNIVEQTSAQFRTLAKQMQKKQVFVQKGLDGQPMAHRMVEIITEPNIVEVGPPRVVACKVYGDPEQVQDKLDSDELQATPPKHVTGQVLTTLVEKCQRHMLQTIASKQLNAQQNNATGNQNATDNTDQDGGSIFEGIVIYPGTKWCGAGTIAENYDDLGLDSAADACCREHDHCDDSIKAGGTKYNLTNMDSYTKSACECDQKFAECLKTANTYIAHQIGRTYFNVIQIQCFKEDYPIIRCVETKGFAFNNVHTSCQEYELDVSQAKRVQFWDPPFYDGDAGPLLNIPGISGVINEPLKGFKDKTINGGFFGSVVG